jgi:hypothetical protein
MRAMASLQDRRVSSFMPPRQVNWRGRSGRFYALAPARMETFALAADGLYLLARGTLPVWVGSADDVIHDPASRARFRLALEMADRAFLVEAEGDEVSRMTTVWDLEGAEPVSGLSAA